jgi:methylase of polypeptide subunit release factors
MFANARVTAFNVNEACALDIAPDYAEELLSLLQFLAKNSYGFITTTPLTHQRILNRIDDNTPVDLRDVFGWNMQFTEASAPAGLIPRMQQAGILRRSGTTVQSVLRVATLNRDLFLHSGFPTLQEDSVFFGPDTYRFAQFILRSLSATQGSNESPPLFFGSTPLRVCDIGCGSGAGGIVAARKLLSYERPVAVTMADINAHALRLTAINAKMAGIPVKPVLSDIFASLTGSYDLIICNPPYIQDGTQRAYRHGGNRMGRDLSVRIVKESIQRLAPGGQLLMYTGVAMVKGRDPFLDELAVILKNDNFHWSYEEIDPDVFGEELEQSAYAIAERIAAVGLVVTRKAE